MSVVSFILVHKKIITLYTVLGVSSMYIKAVKKAKSEEKPQMYPKNVHKEILEYFGESQDE